MEWFSLLGTVLKIANDLHIDTNNDPQSFVGELSKWAYSPEGQKTLSDINQLLQELDFPLRVALAHRP